MRTCLAKWTGPLLTVVGMLLLASTPCGAMGSNEGGYLMIHCDPSIEYDPEYPDPSYYIDLFPASCPEISPDSCGYYRLMHDCHYGTALEPTLVMPHGQVSAGVTGIFWVCAVFPDTTCVDLHIVEFGIEYLEGGLEIIDWGHDGRYAYPHVDFPGDTTGIRIEFDPPRTSHVVPLIWFAAFGDYTTGANGRVWLGPYPIHGMVLFYRNGQDDYVQGLEPYPAAGLNMRGFNPRISELPFERVCCFGYECSMSEELDCLSTGGIWIGWDVGCDPNPCDFLVPARKQTWGRIKTIYRQVRDQ